MNRPLRVLLVEDEENLIDLVQLVLEGEGFELHIARDGKDGAAKAASLSPDLILMDVVMPVMNGYECAQAVRSNPVTKNIPIFFLTAKSLEDDIKNGKVAGGSLYLVKPFSPFELIHVINDFFQNRPLTSS